MDNKKKPQVKPAASGKTLSHKISRAPRVGKPASKAKRYFLSPSLLICLLLCCATIIPYYQTKDFPFTNFDDPMYVAKNLNVLNGLTFHSLLWSFTSGYAANWHPLTWISHMIDCSLFGANAGIHHLVNLFIHILNGILLFMALKSLTGALWRSALIAALFALHPLHVESVVWISERKDVLCAFFFFLAMGCYARYVRRRSLGKYLLLILCFTLALLAKPMAVTLPFVLLLLDFWPLNRILRAYKQLILEKIPLLLLSFAACIVTFLVQRNGEAIDSLEVVSLKTRTINAFISYCLYIKKALLPTQLSVFYPFEFNINWPAGIICLFIIITITFFAFKVARKVPYLITGWLWFLGTLVPVIGFVQVGSQSMADRYSYIPLIGLSIIVSWGSSEAVLRWQYLKPALSAVWIAIIIMFVALTHRQVEFWKDDRSLFEHAVTVTCDNYLAYNKLGLALSDKGMVNEAIERYKKALSIKPDYEYAHNNLGIAFAKINRIDDAVAEYAEALRINPRNGTAYNNLGNARMRKGDTEGAISCFAKALQFNPRDVEANNNMGAALARRGKIDEATSHFKESLREAPWNVSAEVNLGMALALTGKTAEAIALFEDALRRQPDCDIARKELDAARAGKSK